MFKKLYEIINPPRVIPSVETWATRNAKRATPDDLIAGVIVASFAKDYKHWKFVGQFNQSWNTNENFKSTSLTRKMVGKKHIEITFLMKETHHSDGYSNLYRYKTIGCEVNGIRLTGAAFNLIYTGWNNIVVEVKRTEQVAEQAKKAMEANEARWNLAESLLGMKRDGLGTLIPVKKNYDEVPG